MEVGGLGSTEIIILFLVVLLTVGGPVAVIVLVLFLINRRKNSTARLKKCESCGYAIPEEAALCQFCGKELVSKTEA
jgi:hypothetical protein